MPTGLPACIHQSFDYNHAIQLSPGKLNTLAAENTGNSNGGRGGAKERGGGGMKGKPIKLVGAHGHFEKFVNFHIIMKAQIFN